MRRSPKKGPTGGELIWSLGNFSHSEVDQYSTLFVGRASVRVQGFVWAEAKGGLCRESGGLGGAGFTPVLLSLRSWATRSG